MHPYVVARLPPVETTNIGAQQSVPIALVPVSALCGERLVTAYAVEATRALQPKLRQIASVRVLLQSALSLRDTAARRGARLLL